MIIYVFKCVISPLSIMLIIRQEIAKHCVLLELLESMQHHLIMFLPVSMIALFPHMQGIQTVYVSQTVALGFMEIPLKENAILTHMIVLMGIMDILKITCVF